MAQPNIYVMDMSVSLQELFLRLERSMLESHDEVNTHEHNVYANMHDYDEAHVHDEVNEDDDEDNDYEVNTHDEDDEDNDYEVINNDEVATNNNIEVANVEVANVEVATSSNTVFYDYYL